MQILKRDKVKKLKSIFKYSFDTKNSLEVYFYKWFLYHNKFFGSLIFRGCKLKAFNFFSILQYNLKLKKNFDPFLLFLISMLKITPNVFLRSIRFGSVTQSIPFPITEEKQVSFAIKWTLRLLKNKYRIIKISTVVDLLISSLYNKGESMQKKHFAYKSATANRYLLKYFK